MKNIIFLSDYEDQIEYEAVFEILLKWGIEGRTVKPSEITITNSHHGTAFIFRGKQLRPDLVIGYSYEDDLLPAIKLMRLWKMEGVAVLNDGETLFCGQNKDLSSAMLNSYPEIRHLPYLKFNKLASEQDLNSIGFPMVAKPVNGACGRGLFKIDTYSDFCLWFQEYEKAVQDYYVQPYIHKKDNQDFRIVVVNHVAIYAYSRRGANGNWVTNLMKDGSGEVINIDSLPYDLITMAEKCSVAARSPFCGVDIAQDDLGSPFVIEINTCPAIKISRYISGADDAVETAYAEFIRETLMKNEN